MRAWKLLKGNYFSKILPPTGFKPRILGYDVIGARMWVFYEPTGAGTPYFQAYSTSTLSPTVAIPLVGVTYTDMVSMTFDTTNNVMWCSGGASTIKINLTTNAITQVAVALATGNVLYGSFVNRIFRTAFSSVPSDRGNIFRVVPTVNTSAYDSVSSASSTTPNVNTPFAVMNVIYDPNLNRVTTWSSLGRVDSYNAATSPDMLMPASSTISGTLCTLAYSPADGKYYGVRCSGSRAYIFKLNGSTLASEGDVVEVTSYQPFASVNNTWVNSVLDANNNSIWFLGWYGSSPACIKFSVSSGTVTKSLSGFLESSGNIGSASRNIAMTSIDPVDNKLWVIDYSPTLLNALIKITPTT